MRAHHILESVCFAGLSLCNPSKSDSDRHAWVKGPSTVPRYISICWTKWHRTDGLIKPCNPCASVQPLNWCTRTNERTSTRIHKYIYTIVAFMRSTWNLKKVVLIRNKFVTASKLRRIHTVNTMYQQSSYVTTFREHMDPVAQVH